MKKIFFSLMALGLATATLMGQEKEDGTKGNTTVEIGLQNMFYWRGAPISVFSSTPTVPSPVITGGAYYEKHRFLAGVWTGQSFDSQGFKNVSYYVGSKLGDLTIMLWDCYTYSGISPSRKADFFNFTDKDTQHFIDLNLRYKFPEFPMSLFLASVVYGRDGAIVNGDYKNRYSTYFKADYTATINDDLTLNLYGSIGGALDNIDGYSFYGTAEATKSFGITEIGATFNRAVNISDNLKIPFSVGVVASPLNKRIDGIVSAHLRL